MSGSSRALLVCFFLLPDAWADQAKEDGPALPSLTLTLHEREHLVGEPIIATLRLGSRTSEVFPLFTDNENFTRTGEFTFIIKDKAGSTVAETRFQGPCVARFTWLRKPKKPGQYWQCDRMFLPAPQHTAEVRIPAGSYTLTAKVLWSPPEPPQTPNAAQRTSGWITSRPVALEIVEPVGRDARAAQLVFARQLRGFFEGELGGKPASIAALLAREPKSAHARYAKARLLMDRAGWYIRTKGGPLLPAGQAEMKKLVQQAYEYGQWPELHPLADNLLLLAARLQRMLNDYRGMAETLTVIVNEHPDGDAKEAAAPWLARLPMELQLMASYATRPATKSSRPLPQIFVVVACGVLGLTVLAGTAYLLLARRRAKAASTN